MMNPPDDTYPGMEQPFSEDYQKVEERLPSLSEFDLTGLAGALVAEFVNRGHDTDTALARVMEAAESGAVGSRIFDQMAD